MPGAILTADLALNCTSDVAIDLWLAIPWDQANSNVSDWRDVTIWSKVSGTLMIRNQPTQREILVISAEEGIIPELGNIVGFHVWANGTSAADGSFTLQWAHYSDDVVVLYLDDYGITWQPNSSYKLGDLVFPSIWNGWQYECVSPGSSGSSEPVWWHDEGSTGFSGTATFIARQYLPAQSDGPLATYQWIGQ